MNFNLWVALFLFILAMVNLFCGMEVKFRNYIKVSPGYRVEVHRITFNGFRVTDAAGNEIKNPVNNDVLVVVPNETKP